MSRDPIAPSLQASSARYVLLIDVSRDTADLLSLWLGEARLRVALEAEAERGPPAAIVFEIPFPKRADTLRTQATAARWHGVPILVISPTIFASVPARGEVARALGVDAVLSTPLSRDRLLGAVRELVGADL